MTERSTVTTFCRICESLCGLEAVVEDKKVVELRPDPLHIVTEGFACPKGLQQHQMYASPDRVQRPQKRLPDGSYTETSWDEAIESIGRKVRQLHGDCGADSIAMYVGTAAGFSVLHPVFAQGFMTGLGSKSMYASATQDCANKFAVSREVYGFPFTLPFPDVAHTECLIIVGANPVVSKWSFLQVPNPAKHLGEILGRGGRVFVVDPRKTETARAARGHRGEATTGTGEHVFIRPDTDVFFYAAFLHEVEKQGGIDRSKVEAHMTGLEPLLELVRPWTPERAAEVTRMPPEKLREMVTAYLHASRRGGAALYCSTGVNMGSNGSLAFWLQEAINAVTGNLDKKGGTLVGKGLLDFAKFGKKNGTLMRTDRSRIGGFTSVNDAFPGGLLADEILTPGDKQVKALFVTGGNPLITMPNAGKLKSAFEKLELLVTLDLYRNETGSLAHWILPCTSPLERPDLPFIFPLMLGLQAKPYLQATRAVEEAPGEVRDEASIYLDLCRASGIGLFGSKVAQRSLELLAKKRPHGRRDLPQELLLSMLLRITGNGGFDKLMAHAHGRARPDHQSDFLGHRVVTDDGKIHLSTPRLLDQAHKLERDFAREKQNADKLKLITKRHVTTHNSWTHNHVPFVDKTDTNYLYLNPDDAARIGVQEHELVDVSTSTATVRLPVKLLEDLMPGTVALPHGWGHQHATGLSVASRTKGVNVNLLAGDGPDALEKTSGMAHLTGFIVDVKKASGPRNEASWSGI